MWGRLGFRTQRRSSSTASATAGWLLAGCLASRLADLAMSVGGEHRDKGVKPIGKGHQMLPSERRLPPSGAITRKSAIGERSLRFLSRPGTFMSGVAWRGAVRR